VRGAGWNCEPLVITQGVVAGIGPDGVAAGASPLLLDYGYALPLIALVY
jgi:hypothetical protein